MEVIEKVLISVNDKDLTAKTFDGWKGVNEIGFGCFEKNEKLEEINIPFSVHTISNQAFSGCKNLKNVKIDSPIFKIPAFCFNQCENLEHIKLPDSLKKISNRAFAYCKNLKTIDLPKGLHQIDSFCFLGCESLHHVDFPDSLEVISQNSFAGCSSLEYISFSSLLNGLGGLVYNTNFKYFYEKNNRYYLASVMPKNMNGVSSLVDFSVCKEMFECFNNYFLMFIYREDKNLIIDFAKKCKRANLKIPYDFIEELIDYDLFKEFAKDGHFVFFAKEMQQFLNNNLNSFETYYKCMFFKLAYTLGCFDTNKMLDKNGKETDTFIYQKATQLLYLMAEKNAFRYMEVFDQNFSWNFSSRQEFLNFILYKEGKKYPNLDYMLELNEFSPGTFIRIMKDFDKVKQFKTYVDENNKPKNRTWKDAIYKYLTRKKYSDVAKKDESMAELLSILNFSEAEFDYAVKLRDIAEKHNIPHHILGKELKEETIVDSIARIKKQTESRIGENEELIKQLQQKHFTYVMLDKRDERNLVLGAYASCCAITNSGFYGATIADKTITEEDLQNMVICDYAGNIIAKGTLYVNNKQGYIVVNDFEINQKYRKNEKVEVNGYYHDSIFSEQHKERDLIFDAFMRGIKDFVKEYDLQNPKNPIRQVNVGRGCNKLQEQLDLFEEATDLLPVPDEYKFRDASDRQTVIYKRGKKIKYTNVKQEEKIR